MLSVVTCDQWSGWNDTGFCDKKYDAMYSKQQLTPDQSQRKDVVWQMQSYLAEKKPYLWIAALDSHRRDLEEWTGLIESPQGPFNSLSKLSLSSVHQAGRGRSSSGRMRGADYFIKRFLFAVVTVFVAITINFALFRLAPGKRRREPLARPARDTRDPAGAEA